MHFFLGLTRRHSPKNIVSVFAVVGLLVGLILVFFPFFVSAEGAGVTYYVSPAGNDSASGTSPQDAWKTLEQVNRGTYRAGDRILLEGGQRFSGSLGFGPTTAFGTKDNPVIISSYGGSRATIVPTGAAGFAAIDVAGFTIQNINFLGPDTSHAASAVVFVNQGSSTLSGIGIVDVEASNLNNGVLLLTTQKPGKYTDIRIERASFHDNVVGLGFFGYITQSGVVEGHYGVENIYIGHSDFSHNTGFGVNDSGNAMSLMNVKNVTVEHNRIDNNGGDTLTPGDYPNGASAILIYDGQNGVIQYNEISRQHVDPDGPVDNAAFDVWVRDFFIQYNYAYGNEGWGMILGAGDAYNPQDPFPWPSERNTIRYNIFENNGRRLPTSTGVPELVYSQLLISGAPQDFEIYNNTFYSRNPGTQGTPVPEEAKEAMVTIVADEPPHIPRGFHFHNNIFAAEDQIRFLDVFSGVDALFENNAYIGGAAQRQVEWNGVSYDSVASWSTATRQETVDGALVARVTSPATLCAPGSGATTGYRLVQGSQLIDTGWDLRRYHNLDVGSRDFFGTQLMVGTAPDIGAYEGRGENCREQLPSIAPPNSGDGGNSGGGGGGGDEPQPEPKKGSVKGTISLVDQKAPDFIKNHTVPAVVARLFHEVYGRRITPAESTYWKQRARTDKPTESKLKGAMQWQKARGFTGVTKTLTAR